MKRILTMLMLLFVCLNISAWEVAFTNPNNWSTVYVYAWEKVNGKDVELCGSWPGTTINKEGDYWTYTGNGNTPTYIIFNQGDDKGKTKDLNFKDGYIYNMTGATELINPNPESAEKWKVYFDNSESKWDSVNVWAWNDGTKTNYTGGTWPGIAMTKDSSTGLYYYEGTGNPNMILFNYKGDDNKTTDFKFENNATYNIYGNINSVKTEYRYYLKNVANWETVYIYAWHGDEKYFGSWPGREMFKNDDGYYEVSYISDTQLDAEGLIFHNNNGDQLETKGNNVLIANTIYSNKDNSGGWSVAERDSELSFMKNPTHEDAPIDHLRVFADENYDVYLSHIREFGSVDTHYSGSQFSFTAVTNIKEDDDHKNHDINLGDNALHENFTSTDDETVSKFTFKPHIAGIYNITINHGEITASDGSKLWSAEALTIPTRVLPTPKSMAIAIQGVPMMPIVAGDDLGEYEYCVYVKKEVMDNGGKFEGDAEYDSSKLLWDPAKRLKIVSYDEASAKHDPMEVFFIADSDSEPVSIGYRGVLRAPENALSVLDDEYAPEESNRYGIYNSLNSSNKSATIQIQQHGITSKPFTVRLYDNAEAYAKAANIDMDIVTGIETPEVAESENIEIEDAVYYDINGLRVSSTNLTPGVYISVKGAKATKVYISR